MSDCSTAPDIHFLKKSRLVGFRWKNGASKSYVALGDALVVHWKIYCSGYRVLAVCDDQNEGDAARLLIAYVLKLTTLARFDSH